MIVRFNNMYLERLYAGLSVGGKPKYSEQVVEKFKKRVILLENIENSADLRQFRGLNFEALKGDRKGRYSVRIDKKYRLEFSIEKDRITLHEIVFIEDLSNHYE